MSDSDAPKIIIDDDWKSSAQAEKEKLVAAEKEKAEQAAKAGPGGLPEQIGFKELLSLFATQALMYMGAIPDQSGRAVVSLEVAKLNIDRLGVIQEKTKGNLSAEEQEMLDGTVGELRMQFVEVTKAVEQAAQDGTLEHVQMDPSNPGMGSGGAPDLSL
jgi:ATP-dependent protease Clp ATPase subunit